ncbi:WGR domain-containing protein [Thiolapillus sp.]|uniref:WGR domain-containing protein n=2 Tax=Thiolapillus sp. TaxID=2017437 RepID=UPI0025FC0092|nr:WGR domain-containing protein [Thiolapillus sp.]
MLRWVNPDNRRYYQVDLVKDLLGDWTVVKAWGSLDSHRGNQKICLVSGKEDGLSEIQGLIKERLWRGYALQSSK